MVKSLQTVAGYDIGFSGQFRFKSEIYAQYIYNAAVEKAASSFSMLNAGTDFTFPDKTNLVNYGKGYNYGVELTLERFLHKGFYCLLRLLCFSQNTKPVIMCGATLLLTATM